MFHSTALTAVASILIALHTGCSVGEKVHSTWHQKFNWKAEDFFDDPKVIGLCRAIEANDVAEIDRLIAEGANVNAKGKGAMTPLLWAFPDNKLERFRRLLDNGANPNVLFESDFGTRGAIMKGSSVTHMACETAFPGYFAAVFAKEGDVNLVQQAAVGNGDTPIMCVVRFGGSDKEEKIKLLVTKGANLNHQNGAGITPPRLAVGWGGQYDIARMLLEAGADYKVYLPNSNSRLIHSVAAEKRKASPWTTNQKAEYERLVNWLEDHGESIEKAKADLERWASWSTTTGEYQRKMAAEVAARKAREAREKKSGDKAPTEN
jgi:ankyrin repeat protein